MKQMNSADPVAVTEALQEILDYLWMDERKDWISQGRPKDHIYKKLMLVQMHLKGR